MRDKDVCHIWVSHRAITRIAACPLLFQPKADAACGFFGFHLGDRPQDDIQLTDMLDELGFQPIFIAAIKCQDIGFEKPHTFDLQNTRIPPAKPMATSWALTSCSSKLRI